MSTKKDYIKLIRWSCFLDSFANNYFIRIIVIYLLSQNVTPWVAVSVPIVLEFSRLISRAFKFTTKFALKVDYKKYHIFHLIMFFSLGIIISQCRNVFTIYLFTIISGFLSGIKHSTITKINTQNKEYEPYCFIEEERAQVIGWTLGLLVSQIVYDFSPKLYLLGYLVLIVLGTIFSLLLKNVSNEDVMAAIDEAKPLDKKSKNNTILVTTLFGILAGLWCMSLDGFYELAPLISKKIGYLEAVYTGLEFIFLFIISGSIITKIRQKKKMLFAETIVACTDIVCLLIASLTLSWKGLLFAFILTGITSTLGDPLWGSIMSAYSTNNRAKWTLVNKSYFIVRGIFCILSWFICRECVIRGIESFKYLAVILLILVIIIFAIANKINKRIFGEYI